METIIDYFSTIQSSHRAMILAGGIAFFWVLESVTPLFDFKYRKWHHAGINLFFTGTTIVVNFTMAFLLLTTADWVYKNDFGILNWLPQMNSWLYAIIGLLLLDLIGAWLAHFAQHKTRWMWRFHLIHHTDTWIDTTSANRHHPGESVIRFVFTMLAVLVSGSPMWLVFLYQSLSVVFSQFNHANITLPGKLDKIISYVIVSPDMHKVHHHYVLPYTDSNYGNIFSIWDRIFKTFLVLKREDIVYGVDTHMDENEHNRLKNLLKIPFSKYRPATQKRTE
ncbi:MAG: sterol desaturase family protein [Flavobacterium sp.]|uniref:sterol desaturase family protein n=1 Tax=Flavobacterium sp. TaxID=239 RepID=UPI0012082A0D|nr:sterol desaturase family protein [Flavobacterium sp.]RZJ65294.1 MAG: sterol desaturase family protein [Flavobacterium sp.]